MLYARLYKSAPEFDDLTREQTRRVMRAAEQIGYDLDAIENMLHGCQSREDCDDLIAKLTRELAEVVRYRWAR